MSDFRRAEVLRGLGFIGRSMAGALCAVLVLLLAGLAVAGPQSPDASEGAKAAYGKTIYRVYCASCHGASGQGDGKLADYLTVKPSDLTQITKRNHGEFPAERLTRIIDGREDVTGHSADMPVWGDAFQKTDALEKEPPDVREAEVARKIDSLLAYLHSIQVTD